MATTPRTAHVSVASLNQTVGDWDGNEARIRAAIDAARATGARLLGLPELCISGYDLGDRVLMRGTLDRSWAVLASLEAATVGMVVIVGLPLRHDGVLYNAAAVLADGRLVGLVCKGHLATGDVQYENRWYQGWPISKVSTWRAPDGRDIPIGNLVFEAYGLGRFAIEICEDGWKGLRPGSVAALSGAQILINPSASWFVMGKHRVRRRMVRQISAEDHTAYLYTSLLGCDATRLVFDGSVFIAVDGRILEEARRFRFTSDFELIDRVIDVEALSHARMEEGSWRQQVEALQEGSYGTPPTLIRLDGDFSTPRPAPAPRPYWEEGTTPERIDPSLEWLHDEGLIRRPTAEDLPYLELELALALGMHQYVKKCGIPGITLALSGGRDSSMCAMLVHRLHRYDRPDLSVEALREHVRARFTTAYLATRHSSAATRGAAAALAAEIGAKHLEAEIQDTVDLHVSTIEAATGQRIDWTDPKDDIPLQNVQARLRGSLIWFIANLDRFLLISTSNKSEAAVGYATMDGDTSGGLSPIADVPKSLVTAWVRWAADFHGYESVQRVLSVPATAELRPADRGQTDEDDLMPFVVLDQLMYLFVQRGQEPVEMFRTLWPSVRDRYDGPAAFAAHIRKFVRMLCAAQWKRERFAISFRVTAFDLDPKTGFRFPPVQAPFTRELADLDAYVATLAG